MSYKENYSFDFKNLESVLAEAYFDFCEDENEKTRTDIFYAIKNLSFAVLSVNGWESKYDIDCEEISYNYSLYLMERLLKGFRFKIKDRFPWTYYIGKNLLHVIINKKRNSDKWNELATELKSLLEVEPECLDTIMQIEDSVDDKLSKENYSLDLFKALSLHYSESEIKRLLPLSMDLINGDSGVLVNSRMPDDVRDFSIVLIALSKRLCDSSGYNKQKLDNSEKAFVHGIRSSVFLSAVVKSEFFPRELLLSLDIDSLYRLVQIAGGQTIRIPYQKELDSLLGAINAIFRNITEGMDINEAVCEAKKSFNLNFSKQICIPRFISKIVDTFSVFSEDSETEPIIGILIDSIQSLDKMLSERLENNNFDDSEKVHRSYEKLAETVSSFADTLSKMKGVDSDAYEKAVGADF